MSLILTDLSNVTVYTFPAGFDLHVWNDRDFSARGKLLDRFGAHGARQVGDRAIEPRKVVVKGAHHAASQAALTSFLDAMTKALFYNGEEYRFSWATGFYIGVSHVDSFKAARLSGGLAYKSAAIEIRFVCPDPFWYSTTDDSLAATSITTSPQDLVIVNNGTVPSPLVVQCDPTAAWADFTLENVTDGGNLCRYADSALGNGDQVILDSRGAGTVERDGENTIRHFSGAWLRILPGNNTIRYTGPTGGTITLTSPGRFL
ncbi:MAG: hypothetical protein ABIJ95_08145 [Pseudomonadota bacterium]